MKVFAVAETAYRFDGCLFRPFVDSRGRITTLPPVRVFADYDDASALCDKMILEYLHNHDMSRYETSVSDFIHEEGLRVLREQCVFLEIHEDSKYDLTDLNDVCNALHHINQHNMVLARYVVEHISIRPFDIYTTELI